MRSLVKIVCASNATLSANQRTTLKKKRQREMDYSSQLRH